jgi:hypothetical protein
MEVPTGRSGVTQKIPGEPNAHFCVFTTSHDDLVSDGHIINGEVVSRLYFRNERARKALVQLDRAFLC